jgi:hypothetical protein
MLQRIQTVWLTLALAAAVLSFKFSFFSGNKTIENLKSFSILNATTNIWVLILSVVISSLILVDIFLFKNRKIQIRIALASVFLSLLNIYLYYRQTVLFEEGKYSLSAIFVLAIPILLLLAMAAIKKDEKLVRSLDRLR